MADIPLPADVKLSQTVAKNLDEKYKYFRSLEKYRTNDLVMIWTHDYSLWRKKPNMIVRYSPPLTESQHGSDTADEMERFFGYINKGQEETQPCVFARFHKTYEPGMLGHIHILLSYRDFKLEHYLLAQEEDANHALYTNYFLREKFNHFINTDTQRTAIYTDDFDLWRTDLDNIMLCARPRLPPYPVKGFDKNAMQAYLEKLQQKATQLEKPVNIYWGLHVSDNNNVHVIFSRKDFNVRHYVKPDQSSSHAELFSPKKPRRTSKSPPSSNRSSFKSSRRVS